MIKSNEIDMISKKDSFPDAKQQENGIAVTTDFQQLTTSKLPISCAEFNRLIRFVKIVFAIDS